MTSDSTFTEAGVVTERSHESVHDTVAARHHLTANLAGISALTDALVAS
jgi:hypothetical protein